MHVHITGSGITAWCCATLLRRSGCSIGMDATASPQPPVILLDAVTAILLAYVAGDTTLLQAAPRVDSRTVNWGEHSEKIQLNRPACIFYPEVFLADAMARLEPLPEPPASGTDWTIFTAPQPSRRQKSFGTRKARFADVELKHRVEQGTCQVESVEGGWMFLIDGGDDRGTLLSVGGDPQSLLRSSRHIGPRIADVCPRASEMDAYPRIATDLFGKNWMACGSAAMTLDPICGDGLGHAIRQAILATAVLREISKGGDASGLLRHYADRLESAFHRHLELCRESYSIYPREPWWETERKFLRQDLRLGQRSAGKKWRYRLRDLDLVPLDLEGDDQADQSLPAKNLQSMRTEPVRGQPTGQSVVR